MTVLGTPYGEISSSGQRPPPQHGSQKTEASPQSTGCLTAKADSSQSSSKSTKTQRTQIIDCKTFFYW